MQIFDTARSFLSADKKLYRSFKNVLGFYPGNIELYKQAFRHSSVAKEIRKGIKNSNERLEFLGDAILGAVIANYLFRKFPYKDEGFLTKMRSKMVSKPQLNQLALKLGIDKYVEVSNSTQVSKSAICEDAFEALIGAIYLDKGYYVAEKFILNRIIKNHIDMEEVEARDTDYKSRLLEYVQKYRMSLYYELVKEVNKGREKQFVINAKVNNEVKGTGQHYSKKRAEQLAAEQALKALNGE